MGELFLFLSYLTTLAFFVGLVKPSIFSGLLKKRATRKGVVIIFGLATMGFSILSSLGSEAEEKPIVQVDSPAQDKLAKSDVPTLVVEMNKAIAAGHWRLAVKLHNSIWDINPDHPRLANARIIIQPRLQELKRKEMERQAEDAKRVATEKKVQAVKQAAKEEAAKLPASGFGDGMFIVGTDIQPGTYRSSGSSGCYYSRLSGFGGSLDEIIANENTDSVAIVRISSSDKGFKSSDCGTWTKIK